jgi:hypothetical protein
MDQEVSRDELQQIKDLLGEVLKLQELILHRLDRLELTSGQDR